MNPRPIDEAKSADLRGSFKALQRAAHHARIVAARTGTALVISRDGVVEYLQPDQVQQQTRTASPPVPASEPDDAERFLREDLEWGLKGDD